MKRRFTSPRLAAVLLLFGLLDIVLVAVFAVGGDWAPLWAGARTAFADPAVLYDFERITALQRPWFGAESVRPFVYPPSALLFIAPFAWLPMTAAMIAFIALTGWLFMAQAMRIGAHPGLLLAPPVVLAGMVGQTSFLIGGLVLAGLAGLRSRPLAAGVLIGIAAALKPTLLILAPLALLACGQYRALIAAVVAGALLIAISMLWLGYGPWLAWLEAIPRFQALFMADDALVRTAVTPYALAARFGFRSPLVVGAGAVIAAVVVVAVFRRSKSVAARSVALFGGALLITPYAMNYELALLAPAVMTVAVRRWRDTVLPAAYAASLFATASLAGLVLVLGWFAVRAMGSAGDDPCVDRRIDIAP